MKLNTEEIDIIKLNGYSETDISQIQKAIHKTIYKYNGNKITAEEAKKILGTEKYLSGLSRSAFHWSATRTTDNGDIVYFNSSKLFK